MVGGAVAPRVQKSPFFRPSEAAVNNRRLQVLRNAAASTSAANSNSNKSDSSNDDDGGGVGEHKSTVLGCASNLINAIVGGGIVGLPFAMKCTGFWSGLTLIVFVAVLTEKSLRLLIETAKHVHVPSYE